MTITRRWSSSCSAGEVLSEGREEATQIMLHVHQHGVGECGIYTYEVAETKVTQVMDFARKHQHPLQCVMEKK
jgi:ATP-dependent Clp protease adaptor protein ClpS